MLDLLSIDAFHLADLHSDSATQSTLVVNLSRWRLPSPRRCRFTCASSPLTSGSAFRSAPMPVQPLSKTRFSSRPKLGFPIMASKARPKQGANKSRTHQLQSLLTFPVRFLHTCQCWQEFCVLVRAIELLNSLNPRVHVFGMVPCRRLVSGQQLPWQQPPTLGHEELRLLRYRAHRLRGASL